MAMWKKSLLFVLFALISVPAVAQQNEREAEREAERAAERQMRAAEEQQRVFEVQMKEAEGQRGVYEIQMRAAEERLAEAARQIAELSRSNLPAIVDIERRIHMDGRVVLGITIGSDDGDGPVEGVSVRGISPGGAAADAGLKSGDIITAVNDE